MTITVLLDDEAVETAPPKPIRLVVAESTDNRKQLSPKEEVQLWLDSFALAFGLDDGRKRRRWMDV